MVTHRSLASVPLAIWRHSSTTTNEGLLMKKLSIHVPEASSPPPRCTMPTAIWATNTPGPLLSRRRASPVPATGAARLSAPVLAGVRVWLLVAIGYKLGAGPHLVLQHPPHLFVDAVELVRRLQLVDVTRPGDAHLTYVLDPAGPLGHDYHA